MANVRLMNNVQEKVKKKILDMAYVSVDLIGGEWIHANEPKLNMKYGMYTDEIYESWDGQGGKSVYHHDSDIELPKGTIEKIIGKKLSFNDGPVKI